MITLNNKEVFFPTYYLNYHRNDANPTNSWSSWRYGITSNSVIFEEKKETIKKAIKKEEGVLKENSVLLFGASSEFPRFKLTDSKFKRCIKLGKQDFIVVSNDLEKSLYDLDTNIVVELTNKVYIFNDSSDFTFAVTNQLFQEKVASNLQPSYKGTLTVSKGKSGQDIANILDGSYKNIVYDKDLDKMISDNFDVLTEDTIKDIKDLLGSSDSGNRGIGLKLLSGYNIAETPFTTNLLLGKYPALERNSEFRSVGVKQMLDTINWKGFYQFPNGIYGISAALRDLAPLSETDKNLSREEILSGCRDYLDRVINDTLNSNDFLKNLGISITYEVK